MTLETVKTFFDNALEESFSNVMNRKPTSYPDFIRSLAPQVQPNNLTHSVKKAFNYYKENVENRDIGGVSVFEVNVDNVPFYAVSATTDGDNGYLEVYSKTGEQIACGQHNQNLIDWKSQLKTRDLFDEYEPEEIKQFFANGLKESGNKKYFVKNLGEAEQLDLDDLPHNVKQAYDFYEENVEEADIGSVKLYDVSVDDSSVYTVTVTTDGDSGFLELYTQRGELIACAQHDTEAIHWSNLANIRAILN